MSISYILKRPEGKYLIRNDLLILAWYLVTCAKIQFLMLTPNPQSHFLLRQ